jgi:hypothetical protein
MEPLLVGGHRCRQRREKAIRADPGDPTGVGEGGTQFGPQLRGPRQPYLGFTRDAWAASATPAMTPSVLASSIASPHRRTLLPDRQPCEPPLGMADVHGFPQVRAGHAAGRRFWLDELWRRFE